jgi:amino acid transporter
MSISFSSYIKQLFKIVLSSSVVLGLIVGLALLITGETTMGVDLTFEFGPFDGFWWMLGVPVLAILIFVILSPLSFLIHRQLTKKQNQ